MKMNNWHKIWSGRDSDIGKLKAMNEFALYKELKRIDGFDVDVLDSNGYYAGFYNSIIKLYAKLQPTDTSVYEVGSGSGANLLIFRNRGLKIGGIDYSDNLCRIASAILVEGNIVCNEAINLDVADKYDAVISDSVFAYFQDEEYAITVLDKMIRKAKHHIVCLEILDKAKENECLIYRRSQIKNYDELYAGLDKMFYHRNMFETIAKRYHCQIEFFDVCNDYYWNSKYMYNVYFTKQ